MSLPPRPNQHHSPKRDQRQPAFRDSPSRRRRPSDLEAHAYDNSLLPANTPSRRDGHRSQRHAVSPSPAHARGGGAGGVGGGDGEPMMTSPRSAPELGRKKSLIRPERGRIDRDHPNYQYRKHAQNMNVYPSTTGNDPILEADGEAATVSSDSTDVKALAPNGATGYADNPGTDRDTAALEKGGRGRLHRKQKGMIYEDEYEKRRQKEKDAVRPPSFWSAYCAVITFWAPDAVLKCFGKPAKAQQRAWREKIGLISIILAIGGFVGYLTFGFTQTVCANGGRKRTQINQVGNGSMIFHGQSYELSRSRHSLARGIPDNSNVLFGETKRGGMDGSFLFQNVNGACKDLITRARGSDVPTNADGDLAWYFPCTPFNQDGSTRPNLTVPFYSGYSCHTARAARDDFYRLESSGDVAFTWDDIRNNSRNLMVWGGNVLDLNLLQWMNKSQVSYPDKFDDIRTNPKVRGVDVTLSFSSSGDRQIGRCLSEIIKVGSVDTDSIGCIASRVVLYVSLAFILSIVLAKFLLALIFEWTISRRFAPAKMSKRADAKKRAQQIEEWSEDIYRPPPKLRDHTAGAGGGGGGSPDRASRRGSGFLPTTSRFTSPYAIDRSFKNKPAPTTMTNQSSTSRLLLSSQMYKHSNQSQGTTPTHAESAQGKPSMSETRTSVMLSQGTDQRYSTVVAETDGPGPSGFIHEAVVPQPPAEWQPFGYPLAHTICLVTAYSEGAEGLRSTLDSIATTDYPNSHKLILVICDGLIKGRGEDLTTPDITLAMMRDHALLPDEVQAFSYVAVASGSKRHNMAKIYSGFYDYGEESRVPSDRQHRVPMMVVVKCGTPDEAGKSKPGNRGKRDSQIILMSFLQKVMFDERMTELEFEMFNGIWKITGLSPDFYETVLMVDADTKVYPDSLTHMISAMVKDPEIMGLCGETKIANKRQSWVSKIQVFEYFVSHHLSKSFESVFGGVTCLPGCFCMYRIKTPKGGQNYWVPILANPDIVEHYSENVVDTLHKKNLLLLGEDRYLSTLMLKTFPKRKQVFVPQAVCKTTVPHTFGVLLSQRRRWINSTVHNLMELVLVRDLCGTFCFSMQFVVFVELVGTLVLPAAISFTLYLIAISLKAAITNTEAPVIPLILLALILGLPGFLIVISAHSVTYVWWMFLYLLSLPIWNFVLPTYAYWKFDDFSWGDTRKTAGEKTKKAGIEYEGEFDSSKITMKRWGDFEQERRLKAPSGGWSHQSTTASGWSIPPQPPLPSQSYHHQQQQQHGYDPYYDN